MKYTRVKKNFIYPKIRGEHYRFGSNKFSSPQLRLDGDWRDYIPDSEDQSKYGVESSACYIYAQQHAIETLQEEKYGLRNEDHSPRFNALLSNGTEYGGDPLEGAESMRKNDGLVKETSMPFSETIKNWQDYHSWKEVNEIEVRKEGKDFLKEYSLNYDIVFERNESVEQKYTKLKEALKYSPVPMSVLAWYEEGGQYIKPKECTDNHLTLCIYVDESNRPYFLDSYSPYLKIGEPFYNSDFALRWSVERLATEPVKSFGARMFECLKSLFQ